MFNSEDILFMCLLVVIAILEIIQTSKWSCL